MNIKRNIIFSLESRKRDGVPIVDNIPIRMRVVYGGKRIEFITGYRIDASKWDAGKQRVKNGCSNKLKQTASEINSDLNGYSSAIQAIFKEFEVQDLIPLPKQLKDVFNTRIGSNDAPARKGMLQTTFIEFIKECGGQNNWSTSTYKNFEVMKNHLTGFDDNLSLDDINESYLNEYVYYLSGVPNFTRTKS